MGELLPVCRSHITADVVAGITLAAVSIPVALGQAKIAGMPVVTGLYTLLFPMAVFAVLGSSRHLVVGADSATAAILGAALAGLAVAGSPHYVRLAGLAALLAGGLLLLARLARLGFLANFLSRTVLVGFLTGVRIQVAARQLPDLLGVSVADKATPARLWDTARALPQAHAADLAVLPGLRAERRRRPAGPDLGFRAFCARRGLPASPAPQLERARDAWQGERYRRGDIGQRPAGTGNPFRLC